MALAISIAVDPMGGFTLRIGGNIPVATRAARPQGISVAFETLSLFRPTAMFTEAGQPLGHQRGTSSVTTIGIAIGFDSY